MDCANELRLIQSFDNHDEDQVWSISWSHSGQFLASCGLDKVIRIWGRHNPSQIDPCISNINPSNNQAYNISTLKNSPEVNGDHWNNDSNYWISGELCCIATLEDAQTRSLRSCDWSPDDMFLASASFDGTIIVWESQNNNHSLWEQVASLEGHDSEVKCVSWNSNGTLLATCGRDKKIWIWERLHSSEYECISVLDGHTQDVKFLKFHHRENILFSCGYDDVVKVWCDDGDDWYCKDTLIGHQSTVWGVAISPYTTKPRIASCSDDMSIIIWECDQMDLLGKWRILTRISNAHKYTIYSIDWSKDHNRIITGSGGNDVAVFVFEGDGLVEENRKRAAHDCDVNCVRWNPNVRYSDIVASCGDDGMVKIWRYTPK